MERVRQLEAEVPSVSVFAAVTTTANKNSSNSNSKNNEKSSNGDKGQPKQSDTRSSASSENLPFLSAHSYVFSDHGAYLCRFLCIDIILHLSSRKRLRVINITDFLRGDGADAVLRVQQSQGKSIVSPFDAGLFARAIKHDGMPDDDYQFQAIVRDREGNLRYTYNNAFAFGSSEELYFLGNKSVFSGHLYKWIEAIRDLIDNNRWTDALKLSLELYHERLYIFSTQPRMSETKQRQKFESQVKDIFFAYLEA